MALKSAKNSTVSPISKKRKIIFTAILVSFPFLFILLLELSLRVVNYGTNYRMFSEIKLYDRDYCKFNPDLGKKYFYKLPNMSTGNDLFLKDKPKNGFRIFVIGSSTTAGFPYTTGVTFPRILQSRLDDSYPDKQIEVVNAAMTAINSFAFQDRIDEILDAKPDAILIYGGHNEFYGGLGIASKEALGHFRWLKILHLHLLDYKTYQLTRDFIFGIQQFLSQSKTDDKQSVATMMQKIAANKDIEYRSKIYNLAHEHYRQNMESILQKCKAHGVPVYFSELISNIKDLPPLGSSKATNFPPAIEVYKQAQEFEKAGQYDKAREAYYKAKDLDCIHFRASEDLNAIIKELSQKYGATFIPMKNIFEAHSPNGLIGNNLITEHLHPNIDGYFLIADAFYKAITDQQIIGKLNQKNYKPSGYYRENWGFTELDSLTALISVNKIKSGWPFRPEDEVNNYIANYKPDGIIDSIAYQSVRYTDINAEAAHRYLAKVFIAQNAPEKAIREYLANLNIEPYNIENYTDAGSLLVNTGQFEKAITVLTKGLKITRDTYLISLLAEAYLGTKNYRQAIEFLEELNVKYPDFNKQKIAKLLFDAYQQSGETAKANAWAAQNKDILAQGTSIVGKKEQIIRIKPEIGKLMKEALQSLKSGNTNQGLELLYQANSIQESAVANRMIGEILLQRKDKQALEYFKKVYRNYNTDPQFLNTFCYALIYFEEYSSAQKVLQELKQIAPKNPNIPNYEKKLSAK